MRDSLSVENDAEIPCPLSASERAEEYWNFRRFQLLSNLFRDRDFQQQKLPKCRISDGIQTSPHFDFHIVLVSRHHMSCMGAFGCSLTLGDGVINRDGFACDDESSVSQQQSESARRCPWSDRSSQGSRFDEDRLRLSLVIRHQVSPFNFVEV